jgi:hypothetical protein
MEEFANSFARDYFFNESQLKYISPLISNEYAIKKYSETNNIHPSFIYSFYCWDKKNVWGTYQKFIPSAKKMLQKINISLVDFNSIKESEPIIKEILEPQTLSNGK